MGVSSKSIKAFEAFRAAQGQPVAKPVDVTGRAAMLAATRARRERARACPGHQPEYYELAGKTVYCDGSCCR